jgi:ankyrin repeat protein
MNSTLTGIIRMISSVGLALLVAGCGNIRDAARSGDGETALHWACRQGHVDIARYLLAKGADVSEKGTGCGTPLQWAVEAGQRKTTIILLDHGADVNQPGTDEFTALHVAVLKQDVEMVKLLLSRGSDPNAKASYDRSPLFCVQRYAPNEKIAELLRRHGAQEENAQSGSRGD